jgi:hypothetical protein
MVQVIIKDNKDPNLIHISGEIIIRNLTRQTTENDYFEQAWKDAVEDKVVDPARKADYEFELLHRGQ